MWAKVVNNEIFQTWDEDPTGLWHPDQLKTWQEVPDHVNVGWKFKNGTWISGGQWLEEDREENPLPPPGPPSAQFSRNAKDYMDKTEFTFMNLSDGFVDSIEWTIQGQKYTDDTVKITVNKTSSPQTVAVSLTAVGPGGSNTKTLEEEEELTVSALPPGRT